VVNAFLDVDATRPRRLLRMRGHLRRGLVGLKEKLEGETR
jgi:hypothetical protein